MVNNQNAMHLPTVANTMSRNQTDIRGNFHKVSWTKDSILLRWGIDEGYKPFVQGYEIAYTAIGSTVKQVVNIKEPETTTWELTKLHENTYYKICMMIDTNLTTEGKSREPECFSATTATDSLSVALGSTFGAFLALGIIVMFVFLAKWQHNRKLKRQLQQVTPSIGDSFDSIAQQDGEIEMSDVSLQVHDDTIKWEGNSSQSSSQYSNFANGAAKGPVANAHNHITSGMGAEAAGPIPKVASAAAVVQTAETIPEETSKLLHGNSNGTCTATNNPSTSSTMVPLLTSRPSVDYNCDGHLKPPPIPGVINQPQQQEPADVRPKDVRPKDVRPKDVRPKDVRPKDVRPKDVRPKDRPKDRALQDLSNAYQSIDSYGDPEVEHVGIRPNMSCNW